jgi:hypothetical protein
MKRNYVMENANADKLFGTTAHLVLETKRWRWHR